MGTARTVEDQRLALAMDAAQLGSWTWDIASGVTTWDERLEEMHGLPPGGFGGGYEDWVASLHPDDRATCIERVEQALAHPGPYELRHRTIWPDGSLHSIECRGTVLVDDEGQPTGTTGVAIEVTMRDQLVQVFQRALLPASLPTVPGVTLVARYRASERRNNIGGDWYAANPAPVGTPGAGHRRRRRTRPRSSVRHGHRPLQPPCPCTAGAASRGRSSRAERRGQDLRTGRPHHRHLRHPGSAARTWTYASAGHVPAVLLRLRVKASSSSTNRPTPPSASTGSSTPCSQTRGGRHACCCTPTASSNAAPNRSPTASTGW